MYVQMQPQPVFGQMDRPRSVLTAQQKAACEALKKQIVNLPHLVTPECGLCPTCPAPTVCPDPVACPDPLDCPPPLSEVGCESLGYKTAGDIGAAGTPWWKYALAAAGGIVVGAVAGAALSRGKAA